MAGWDSKRARQYFRRSTCPNSRASTPIPMGLALACNAPRPHEPVRAAPDKEACSASETQTLVFQAS